MHREEQRQNFWLKAALEVTNQNQEYDPPHNLAAKIDKSVPKMIFRRMEQNKSSKGSYCVAQKIVESLKFVVIIKLDSWLV